MQIWANRPTNGYASSFSQKLNTLIWGQKSPLKVLPLSVLLWFCCSKIHHNATMMSLKAASAGGLWKTVNGCGWNGKYRSERYHPKTCFSERFSRSRLTPNFISTYLRISVKVKNDLGYMSSNLWRNLSSLLTSSKNLARNSNSGLELYHMKHISMLKTDISN